MSYPSAIVTGLVPMVAMAWIAPQEIVKQLPQVVDFYFFFLAMVKQWFVVRLDV